MSLPVLGIDVAKQTLVVVLLINETSYRADFANTDDGFRRLLAWLRKRKASQVHACLEATGAYGDAGAQALYDAGHLVSVVNPARIVAYAKSQLARNKTDQLDAALIARFCLKEQPPLWKPPLPEVQDLRALVRHRRALQQMRQAEANRLSERALPASVQTTIQAHLAFLATQIEDLERQIAEHIAQHSELKRQHDLLCSIKGIGTLTAAVVLAELGNIRNFLNARQLAAYAGLNPQQFTSGSSVQRRTRLSKIGNANLRAALYFPAIVAKQHNPLIQVFCERLTKRGLVPKAVIGAAMRKLLHLIFGVLKSGYPFDPAFAVQSLAAPAR